MKKKTELRQNQIDFLTEEILKLAAVLMKARAESRSQRINANLRFLATEYCFLLDLLIFLKSYNSEDLIDDTIYFRGLSVVKEIAVELNIE